MFTAALLTIAKIWKHPKCPLIHKWIKKTARKHQAFSLLTMVKS